jgi:MHS family proline/betaine transporter-like MFS transporter
MNFCIKNLGIDAAQIQWMLIPVLLIGTPMFIVFAKLSDKYGRKWIMLTGMALAAVLYIPIYHAMAAQADWKQWTQDGTAKISEEKLNPATQMSYWSNEYHYTNGASRIEKFEISQRPEDSHKPPKVTAVITLPSKNIFIIGILIFVQLMFVCMAYGPIAAFLVELFPPEIRYTSLSLPYHIGNGVFGGLTPLIAESLVLGTGNMFAGLWYPIIVAAVTVVIGVFFIKENRR